MASLAVYRLSHLIAFEDGPGDCIAKIRERAGNSWIGKLMDCPYCVSVWVSLPVAVIHYSDIAGLIVDWLAISGAAVITEKITGKDKNHG